LVDVYVNTQFRQQKYLSNVSGTLARRLRNGVSILNWAKRLSKASELKAEPD